MTMAKPSLRDDRRVGALLQTWRKTRQFSQLGLALEAGVSSRHLSFVETGRAEPSREMVLRLANALDVPLRERNQLLLAAGFAPVYAESTLDAPALAAVNGALDAILRQQEPYPAVVLDRKWDVVRTNGAADRFFGFLLGSADASAPPPGPANVLRMMFDEALVRPLVENWHDVAEALVQRVRREAVGGARDRATQKLLAEVLAYPGVPETLRDPRLGAPLLPVVPIVFVKNGERFSFFSAVTTLGTAQDVTVQEIRIETFFPADEATTRAAKRLSPV